MKTVRTRYMLQCRESKLEGWSDIIHRETLELAQVLKDHLETYDIPGELRIVPIELEDEK